MNDDLVSISNIDDLEDSVEKLVRERLSGLLGYFRFIQETLLIAFHNSGESVPVKNVPNNPQLFAFISTARAFSISKVAMDKTIRGYPLEGFALTRILAELAQCTQYLVRHTGLIDAFVKGDVKLDRVLKLAKNEREESGEDFFGRFWGLMSRYSHASPDLIVLPLKTYANRMIVKLVMSDLERIEDAAYGIMTSLLSHYLIFRAVFIRDLNVVDELNTRDRYIFDPDNIRQFAKFGSLSDQDLERLYSLFTQENNEE